jgi:hypothetical protein
MSKKNQDTVAPFIKLPMELLKSDAFGSLSVNAWRFVRFLMIEHMRRGGRGNGSLLAPRRQLEQSGIGARHVSPAIEEAERLGLVDCRRGTGRRPSTYALTWLPLSDGSAPSNRWRAAATSEGKHLVYPKGSHKGRSNFRREVTTPQNKCFRREAPSKKASYQEEDSQKVQVGESEEVLQVSPVGGIRERLNPGKPNRQDRAMSAQHEIAAVVPLRRRKEAT